MTPRDLAEREGKPIALGWIEAALSALEAETELARVALAVNFSLQKPDPEIVREIARTFEKAQGVIARSDRTFVSVSEAAARRFFPNGGLPPAYAVFDEAIYFTPEFAPFDPATRRGFGPMCRAAMVLHESVHVIDRDSGAPDVHISEWDEPGFSAQSAVESLHNPSSYASFAAQVHSGALAWPREARFGAGRPAE